MATIIPAEYPNDDVIVTADNKEIHIYIHDGDLRKSAGTFLTKEDAKALVESLQFLIKDM